ncbi:hypothetical protein ACFQBY_17325 [Promicromonospora citrea]|uniref:DUF1579 domain-containing protein n=1 Tax=Promicromonospora citrea TaxID=43677 RepID=A0A8H9L9I7_9MICO|nr:hypothetical protein [Promicromonospora citrea]NNH51013.1 hypothetical protein [Promicromonospora citrea]GGM40830.1 hypothetical protein GCM10010102_40420 [Promicromonospora citrea]
MTGAGTGPVSSRSTSRTFYGDDVLGDRPIKVRFVVTRVGRDEARFEQAFSADGGATWETNWVVVDKRVRR